jgi:hypothetical protein
MDEYLREELLIELEGECKHICDQCKLGDFYDELAGEETNCPVKSSEGILFCWDGISVKCCDYFEEKRGK